jgi:hypothetical protein
VAAADLDIVSTMTLESGGRKFLEPCAHNNTMELREARLKIGSCAVRWSFRPLHVPSGQTARFTLDAPPIAPGVANEVHVE